MIKYLLFYTRPQDPVAFKRHYLQTHLPLCRQIPGISRMSYSFEPETRGRGPSWFCVFELECADEEALAIALNSPEARAAADDLPNYTSEKPFAIICRPAPV